MRVVLIAAPGATAASHWSDAAAAGLAQEFLARGVAVEWFRCVRAAASAPVPTQAELREIVAVSSAPLYDVAAASEDLALERALAASLRVSPAAAVVHVGAGARGSPNLLWLAERMGSIPFAVVRSAEVVCHRGDLVDAAGLACTKFDDARRCQACCAASPRRRPRAHDIENRWDLLIAGLCGATAVFVPEEHDRGRLVAAGVAPRVLSVIRDPPAIVARVLERVAVT